MESKKILVIGGAGFIGTNLVNELRERVHDVFALHLHNSECIADLIFGIDSSHQPA